jgi:hypothetical protein
MGLSYWTNNWLCELLNFNVSKKDCFNLKSDQVAQPKQAYNFYQSLVQRKEVVDNRGDFIDQLLLKLITMQIVCTNRVLEYPCFHKARCGISYQNHGVQ